MQPMTVDAEKLECEVVQGRIIPRGCRLMLKELIYADPDQNRVAVEE
jgi:hypothetical protein